MALDVHTAYGEHKCDLCPEPIKPGQKYLKDTIKQPGSMFAKVKRQHYPLCSQYTRGG